MAVQFGKYLLQRKLAEGGMAEVFLARQSGMDGFEKPVVIKRILPHLLAEQTFLDMFVNEAKVAARLSHPAIVQIFDFGHVESQYFIAMEFIHGEDLRNLAKAAEKRGKRPSPALVCRIIADMLGGLHYAHTRSGPDGKRLGLVHRDISPQNVLVTYEGGVKLVDFGIAKATETQEGQQTQAGLLKGKYAYMSPEQCRGKPLDARSDVFAVGILLWELLTWKRLFRRDSDLATLVAVADEPIPHAASLRPDLPIELDRIVARALARSLDERYPSAQAMQGDLEALIRKYGWEADSIRLQQYMRDVFSDKLALQDEAIRAAGLGSIEDLLVRMEEGTRMAWMEGEGTGGQKARTPAGLELPSATQPLPAQRAPTPAPMPARSPTNAAPSPIRPTPSRPEARTIRPPSGPMSILPVPNWPQQQNLGIAGDTGSTLRGAVGQVMPSMPVTINSAPPPVEYTGSHEVPLPPSASGWKRVAVIVATSGVVAAAALGAVFWPSGDGPTGVTQPLAAEATVRVLLDEAGTVAVDGVARPEKNDELEVAVVAGAAHDIVVTGISGRTKSVHIPPLDPGEVRPVRLKLAP